MSLLQNEYITLAIILYVIIYGLAFGLKNWILWVYTSVTNKVYLQSSLGRLLDSIWLVSFIYLVAYRG